MLKKNQGKEDVHSASSGSSEGRGSSLGGANLLTIGNGYPMRIG